MVKVDYDLLIEYIIIVLGEAFCLQCAARKNLRVLYSVYKMDERKLNVYGREKSATPIVVYFAFWRIAFSFFGSQ